MASARTRVRNAFMSARHPDRMIFVGGAPRSGTTIAHAIICTAQGVSRYGPEISFFRGFMSAYRNGKAAWAGHTSAYFDDAADLRSLIRDVSDRALSRVWTALDRPDILAVKDPHLTPFFPDVDEIYGDSARYVTVCRHPFDVVRSRQEVHERSGPGFLFSADDVTGVAREYAAYYRAVLQADFAGRHAFLRYEDLARPQVIQQLAAFLDLGGFAMDRLWGQSAGASQDDAWGSPKYNRPLDLGPRLSALDPNWKALTARICGPVMARLGYPEEPAPSAPEIAL